MRLSEAFVEVLLNFVHLEFLGCFNKLHRDVVSILVEKQLFEQPSPFLAEEICLAYFLEADVAHTFKESFDNSAAVLLF
jgi:hypothetical protein